MPGSTKTSYVISCNGYDAIRCRGINEKKNAGNISLARWRWESNPRPPVTRRKVPRAVLTALFTHMLKGMYTNAHLIPFLISISPSPSMRTFTSALAHLGRCHHLGAVKRSLQHGTQGHLVIAIISTQRRPLPLQRGAPSDCIRRQRSYMRCLSRRITM